MSIHIFQSLESITEMGQNEMTWHLPEEGVLGYFLILLLLLPLIALLPLMFPLFLLEFLGALVFLDSPRGNIVCMSSVAISESMASLTIAISETEARKAISWSLSS